MKVLVADDDPGVLRAVALALEVEGHEVATEGAEALALLAEFDADVLALFLEHPGQVLTHDLIRERIWGPEIGPLSNSLAVYLGYLRRS